MDFFVIPDQTESYSDPPGSIPQLSKRAGGMVRIFAIDEFKEISSIFEREIIKPAFNDKAFSLLRSTVIPCLWRARPAGQGCRQ